MRTAYHQQLSGLCTQLGEMCGLAAGAMEHASSALLDVDLSLSEQVIADHEHIAVLSRRTEETALKLLALQQPVAGDLRTIVGSIYICADIDRMGALADAVRLCPALHARREHLPAAASRVCRTR